MARTLRTVSVAVTVAAAEGGVRLRGKIGPRRRRKWRGRWTGWTGKERGRVEEPATAGGGGEGPDEAVRRGEAGRLRERGRDGHRRRKGKGWRGWE